MKRLFLLLLMLGAFARAQDASMDPAARERLKMLSAAVRGYTVLHDGKPPGKLSVLFYEGLAQNLSDFVRPGSQAVLATGTEIDTKSDYTLEPIEGLKNMVVREKSPETGRDKLLAAFADGTIKNVPAPGGAAPVQPPVASTGTTPSSTPSLPPMTNPGTPPPPPVGVVTPPVPTPPPIGAGELHVNFDDLPPGGFDGEAFAASGVRFLRGKGQPGIYKSERNMVLPPGRKQVLLLGGERVTSLTINFSPPIRRIAVTRIGVAGGASVPTWTLDAFDADGRIVGSAGEEHGLPPQPKKFSVAGNAIVRIQLSTDNRFGDGVWATWSSLPVAEIDIER